MDNIIINKYTYNIKMRTFISCNFSEKQHTAAERVIYGLSLIVEYGASTNDLINTIWNSIKELGCIDLSRSLDAKIWRDIYIIECLLDKLPKVVLINSNISEPLLDFCIASLGICRNKINDRHQQNKL